MGKKQGRFFYVELSLLLLECCLDLSYDFWTSHRASLYTTTISITMYRTPFMLLGQPGIPSDPHRKRWEGKMTVSEALGRRWE